MYVFVNDEPFTERFKRHIRAATKSKVEFGLVPKEQWEIPEWINRTKMQEYMEKLKRTPYGDSESYRKMCRYQSGFFMHHPLLDNYDYYWRIEPNVRYFCNLKLGKDPFRVMRDEKKKYGWVLSLLEFPQTVRTLWATTKNFVRDNPEIANMNGNMIKFVSDTGGQKYNFCHFWSNFEIADLHFMRSKEYTAYFNYLDQAGGFFYERWGDAPVHSIAVALFLDKSEVHYFDNIGYYHEPFTHCPAVKAGTCRCMPEDSMAYDAFGYSCLWRWDLVHGRDPKQMEEKLIDDAVAV
ncbi:hypothetical protein MCUN1_003749 [Malassezia cuniculi]|uniref:Uncharacterized protein n=1 Tax=Malassezia cuniculi TaxID=948313 RepID=A0AAF0EYK7_9BASI|nr:hypothetical protein MCUN1_003749 [Malassezia cuniculi]